MDLLHARRKKVAPTPVLCLKQFECVPSSVGVSIENKKSFTFKQTRPKMIL